MTGNDLCDDSLDVEDQWQEVLLAHGSIMFHFDCVVMCRIRTFDLSDGAIPREPSKLIAKTARVWRYYEIIAATVLAVPVILSDQQAQFDAEYVSR